MGHRDQQPSPHKLSRKYGINPWRRSIFLSNRECQHQWHQRPLQGLVCPLNTCCKFKPLKLKLVLLLQPHRPKLKPKPKRPYKLALLPPLTDFLLVPTCHPHISRALQHHRLA